MRAWIVVNGETANSKGAMRPTVMVVAVLAAAAAATSLPQEALVRRRLSLSRPREVAHRVLEAAALDM